jgi:tetratricopeptide (TPR) repeat protein
MRTSNIFVSIAAVSIAVLVLSPSPAAAQQGLKQPEPSPAATITQTVGLTEIKVSYHRPAVGGRKIWGELVPWGEVWRAGANENTTVSFSSAVKIRGKALAAGTYGVHMIPTQKTWTVIFSNTTVAWGSYGYDQKEDALRVQLSPQPAEAHEERLAYTFDNPTENGTLLTLRWEKLKLPISIEIDTPSVVMAHMLSELRGMAQFGPIPWAQAAQYWLTHGGNLDEAQRMADRSIEMRETYQNLTTRSAIAEKKGDAKLAAELSAKALTVATEADLNQLGYKLLGQKKHDEAIAMFRKIAAQYPASWNAQDSLGEALAAKGDKKGALECYGKALAMVKDDTNRKRIEGIVAKLKAK